MKTMVDHWTSIINWASVRVGCFRVHRRPCWFPAASLVRLSAVLCSVLLGLCTTPPPPPLQTVGASKTVRLAKGKGNHGDHYDFDKDLICDHHNHQEEKLV